MAGLCFGVGVACSVVLVSREPSRHTAAEPAQAGRTCAPSSPHSRGLGRSLPSHEAGKGLRPYDEPCQSTHRESTPATRHPCFVRAPSRCKRGRLAPLVSHESRAAWRCRDPTCPADRDRASPPQPPAGARTRSSRGRREHSARDCGTAPLSRKLGLEPSASARRSRRRRRDGARAGACCARAGRGGSR
jgi:hypothetical protein